MKPGSPAIAALVWFCSAAALVSGAVAPQVDLVSRYVWRGFDLLPDNHLAIQPSVSIELGKSRFTLDVWSSFAPANRADFKTSDEIDLTLSYDFKMPEGWELSAGFTHYGYWFARDFNLRDATSQEVYAAAARTDLPLSPALSVYYDFHQGSGLYVTLGGSHELEVNEVVRVEAGGLIGFNSRQYIDRTGFSDIGLYVKTPLALGRVILTPSIHAMVPLMDEVNEDVEIWFGLSLAPQED